MSKLLTQDEQKWLSKLDRLLRKAPPTLRDKVSAYTTGDTDITMFDKVKVAAYEQSRPMSEELPDMCALVEDAGSDTRIFTFPFLIESTAG